MMRDNNRLNLSKNGVIKLFSIMMSVVLLASLLMTTMFLIGCSDAEEESAQEVVYDTPTKEPVEFMEPIKVKKNPIASFEIKGYGTIRMELFPDIAPNTVCNFIKLINDGAYKNSGIWRCQKDFVIQGGAPDNISTNSPDFRIAGEYAVNGFTTNTLSHTEGVISMARTSYYNSAGQQFFICLSDRCTQLDEKYAGFGKVADKKSMKVAKLIEKKVKSNEANMGALFNTIDFGKVSVETFGETYPDPIRLPLE